MAKRFRIELGFLGLAFVTVFLICLFLWMFILGVWFGQRMMGKGPSPVAEKALKEKIPEEAPAMEEIEPPTVKLSAKTEAPTLTKKTSPSEGKAPLAPSPSTPISGSASLRPSPKPAPESRPVSPTPSAKPAPPSKPASSAKVSTPYYTLQVASFKDPKEAERYAKFFRDRGYFSQVMKVDLPRKGIWYRVYVGKFKSLSEAKRAYTLLKQKKWVKQAYIKRVD